MIEKIPTKVVTLKNGTEIEVTDADSTPLLHSVIDMIVLKLNEIIEQINENKGEII